LFLFYYQRSQSSAFAAAFASATALALSAAVVVGFAEAGQELGDQRGMLGVGGLGRRFGDALVQLLLRGRGQ